MFQLMDPFRSYAPDFPRINGYRQLWSDAAFPELPVGVYKIEFRVLYGGTLYRRVVHTFEVYDPASGANPALASGLPFAFSMPNEQKWLERNSFDPWNPALLPPVQSVGAGRKRRCYAV